MTNRLIGGIKGGLVGLAFACAGALACTGCGSGEYEVVNHIRGNATGAISQEDSPYSLGGVSLYGTNFYAQENAKSATGFSLIPRKHARDIINEEGRKVGIESDIVYLANPFLKDGKPAIGLSLRTKGDFAIMATRDVITAKKGIGTFEENNAKYNIQKINVNGKDFYFPHRIFSGVAKEVGRTNFWTIPRKGHEREISPSGRITLRNPGKINEWVERKVLNEEKRAREEAERKKRNKMIKLVDFPGEAGAELVR